MKIENLSKSELLKMVDSFEHYPAVTIKNDRAFLAYLNDESCSISQDDISKYLANFSILAEFIEDKGVFYAYITSCFDGELVNDPHFKEFKTKNDALFFIEFFNKYKHSDVLDISKCISQVKEYIYSSSNKKEYIAYTNYASFVSFLKDGDLLGVTEKCNIRYWGKKWEYKTTFKSSHKINKICSYYNLGITDGNILIKD